MKRTVAVASLIVAVAVVTMAFSPGWPAIPRNRILIGPFTSWRSCAEPSACSIFGATSFLRDPVGKYLSGGGRFRIALHVDLYQDGSLIGSADGTWAIHLAEGPYPQEPEGYVSIAPVDAIWDQAMPEGPFTAEAHYTVLLLGANGRVLDSDSRTEVWIFGGG